LMSAVLGSALLASVLLLPEEGCWAYMLACEGCGVERECEVVSVGASEGWREGAPE
jgi:hypothetical protein